MKTSIKIKRKIIKGLSPKPSKWISFSDKTKRQVRYIQKNKCAHCNKYTPPYDYDHIINRNNNLITNCQMLCKPCHFRKTQFDASKKRRLQKEKQEQPKNILAKLKISTL